MASNKALLALMKSARTATGCRDKRSLAETGASPRERVRALRERLEAGKARKEPLPRGEADDPPPAQQLPAPIVQRPAWTNYDFLREKIALQDELVALEREKLELARQTVALRDPWWLRLLRWVREKIA